MSKTPYHKPALTYAQQLEQLQARGLSTPVYVAAMGFPKEWNSEPLWQ